MGDALEQLVARRLVEVRKALGLSRYEVARRAGVPVNQVSRVEKLERTPTLSTLARLALALEVAPETLFVEPHASKATKPKADAGVERLTARLRKFGPARRAQLLHVLNTVLDACDDSSTS